MRRITITGSIQTAITRLNRVLGFPNSEATTYADASQVEKLEDPDTLVQVDSLPVDERHFRGKLANSPAITSERVDGFREDAVTRVRTWRRIVPGQNDDEI